MKSQDSLRKSYKKQVSGFEAGKKRRLENVEQQLLQLQKKLSKIQQQITLLTEQREKILSEKFPISEEEFFRKARQQAESAATQTETEK